MGRRINSKLVDGNIVKFVSGVIVGVIVGVGLGDKFEWFEKLPAIGKFFR